MTITNVSRIDVDGNDAATVFSFSPMIIFAASDLLVTHVSAAGVETVLTEGTGASNYSVSSIDYPGTGSITYPADAVTPLPIGESLVIQRSIPLTQSVSLGNQSAYNAKVQEHLFDRVVAMIQDLDDRVEVLPVVPAGGLTPGTVPVVNAEGDGFDYVADLVGDAGATGPAGPAGYPAFYGCLLYHSTTQNLNDSTTTTLTWNTEAYDTGFGGTGFHSTSTNPTRITIPAGVSKVRLSGNANGSSSTNQFLIDFSKNGSGSPIGTGSMDTITTGSDFCNAITAVLEVSEGDYFEMRAFTDTSGRTVTAGGTVTWFAMEVVELSDATTPPIYVDHFTAGAPAASQIVLRYTFATATTILEDFVGSVANSSAAATAAAAFSIQKNGSPIGTMDFAMSADDATFSVTGDQSFVAGDVLSIIAPASPDATLADLAITILGNATAS